LLDFCTLSIVQYSNKHHILETGSISILGWGSRRHLLCWVR
jgi:hypothetical protein